MNHNSVKNIQQKWSHNSFSFREITQTEVLTALEQLNPKKTAGHDLISLRVLKITAQKIADLLTSLHNQVLKQGVWPAVWKWGEWIPVFKEDDHLLKENYRPVTVLIAVDKVFELCCEQLRELTEMIFDDFMSAYRKTYSCETTLIRLLEDWKHTLDHKKVVGLLSSDMSKTFDSMSPSLLLCKLQAHGMSNSSLVLLESYFADRKNRVRLGNNVSDWKDDTCRCPQGSSLGPVLWNIYQNDLFYKNLISQPSMYADDHQLYSSNQTIEDSAKVLEIDGKITSECYKANY